VELHEPGIISIYKIDILLAVENQRIGNDGFIDDMKVGGADDDGGFFDYLRLGNPVIGQESPYQLGDNHFGGVENNLALHRFLK
jgi:hypothetical protein